MATLATPASFTAFGLQFGPGRTVFDQELAGALQQDIATNVVLDWDQLLGGRKTGGRFCRGRERWARASGPTRVWAHSPSSIDRSRPGLESAAGDLDAFVFSQSTGLPAAGAAVRLLDDENQVLRESLADAGGLAHLKCPTNAQWVAAALGQDFHALKIADHEIPLYSFDLPRLWPGEAAPARPVMISATANITVRTKRFI